MAIDFDFDRLKSKVEDLADSGIAKAKELAGSSKAKAKELSEIGKLKMQNVSEQTDLRKAYMDLGKLYYELHRDAPEEAFAPLCATIAEVTARMEYNNERIADIKAAGNLSDEDIPDDEPEL